MALNYKKLLEGKTALITGCGRGIGKATLELFAKAGANVFAVVRKTTDEFLTACKELESECSVRVIPLVADITDKEQVKNIMKQIIEQGLPLDILVNNAGVLGE
jgi:3-oxoacyl-[acyl-carrier protein] reductase